MSSFDQHVELLNITREKRISNGWLIIFLWTEERKSLLFPSLFFSGWKALSFLCLLTPLIFLGKISCGPGRQ